MSHTLRNASSVLALALVTALASGPAAAAAPPDPGTWAQFARTAIHPNTAPAETAFTPANVSGLAVSWKARFGQFASGQGGAAVAGGRVYIGGSDGVLSVFSLPGCAAGSCVRRWRGITGNGIYGTPAVTGRLVLVGSADHFLYAFPARGCGKAVCKPIWRGRLHDAALASVAVADGVAYLGDFGGRIYAFSVNGCGAQVCAPIWTGRAGPNLEFNTIPAVGHGHVYIGALLNTPDDASGRLFAFRVGGCGDPVCRPQWSADLLGQSDGTLSPLVSGSTVFMGSGTRFSDFPNGTRHLFAFAAGGCGKQVCQPLRSYETGDSDLTGGLALSGGLLYAGSQSTPDPNTVGVFTAFAAAGCGASVCGPLWTAVNFASGFESPPVVAGGVVFVAKGPASGFPVDEAVLSYPASGCGARICLPLSFTSVGDQQFYLGAPIAIAAHTLLVPTESSVDGTDDLVALQVH
ncbi:PQQ-binding-like beta-propeller repeat protein [Angustibacter sp. McL0619]|uniref:PQQ-binding-like beta-propeller repeat protein n=1 Tax=Angustibacter sp. McL0619 TaxID=3415676 RepID=UPI003CF57AAC